MNGKDWLNRIATVYLPILFGISGAFFWMDARYMHTETWQLAHIDSRIEVIRGHMRDYERLLENGSQPSIPDEREYEANKKLHDALIGERNKLLKIGGLPE